MAATSERPHEAHKAAVSFIDKDLVIGACGPIHMAHYFGPLTLPLLDVADEHHQRLIRRHGRTAVLGVLEPGIPVPPSEIRARSAELIKQNGAHVVAAGLVVPGEGFWVSAARGVITASFVVARNPYPSKCFGEVSDAARYVLGVLGEKSVSVPEVVAAAQAMKASR